MWSELGGDLAGVRLAGGREFGGRGRDSPSSAGGGVLECRSWQGSLTVY